MRLSCVPISVYNCCDLLRATLPIWHDLTLFRTRSPGFERLATIAPLSLQEHGSRCSPRKISPGSYRTMRVHLLSDNDAVTYSKPTATRPLCGHRATRRPAPGGNGFALAGEQPIAVATHALSGRRCHVVSRMSEEGGMALPSVRVGGHIAPCENENGEAECRTNW